jgi:predicted NBD/HSP70 family sugar kinase
VSSSNVRSTRYFEAAARGIGPTNLRQSNQRAVLSMISVAPGCSNADISRRTGLAPQSVSAVLADLEELGLISRGKVRRGGGRGQPATPFFIDPTGAYAVGIEIGWSHFEVALVDIGTKILARRRWSYDYPDARTIVGDVGKAVADIVTTIPQDRRDRIVGIGLAAAGRIGDPATLLPPPPGQSDLWGKIDLAAEVTRATGFDVHLVNDGNAACWADFVAMPGQRSGNFAYLLVGTFVGAGIMTEDRLLEGASGDSANLGSMIVTDRGGSRRVAHEVASLYALRRRLGDIQLEAAIGDAAFPDAQAVVGEWIEDASFALAQVVLETRTVLEFDLAVVEAELPAPIRLRLVEAMRRNIADLTSLVQKPEVIEGHIGRSGAAQGAAFIRTYRRLFSRELGHMDL